jgi:S-adenosylmethionine synthetase
MIRMSEAVLPGHPDKFCDAVAEAIVEECYKADERAYCQVEMSVWSDQIFLTGGIVTREPLPRELEEVVRKTGRAIGYVKGNAIDVERYEVQDHVCKLIRDPREWTDHVNDQCIATGWAGYDAKTDFLPLEHWLALRLKDDLFQSCRNGRLKGQGPDGKVLVRVRENSDDWHLEHVLVTLQQLPETDFMAFTALVVAELEEAYRKVRQHDRRWAARWQDIDVMVNPNGPLLNGGSDGDNGQTGRKLAMDYYGPRVPIGGGAIYGKDHAHIDRRAVRMAREIALREVEKGARECLVTVAFAPNVHEPLEVVIERQC